MNRREAIATSAFFLGGTLLGTAGLLLTCTTPQKNTDPWSSDDIALLDEVAETILPATAESPGGKEARVGEYMKIMVIECYNPDQQKIFLGGIRSLREVSKLKYGKDFMVLSSQERYDLLVSLDLEAKELRISEKENGQRHYFSMMKDLTMEGYFTSEPGATKALRYVPIPGRYDGCIDYTKGEPAWA